jgi:DNA-binding MarR family transcriptional regulator
MDSPGLARWESAVAGERIPLAALHQMRAQPRFAEAARKAVSGSLALYERDPVMALALKDVGRIVLAIIALSLDAQEGLTLSRLQGFLVAMRLTSPGRAASILLHLRLIRYVEPAEMQADRRVRLYRSTERMRRAFTALFRNELEALALVEPSVAAVLARFDTPEAFNPFIVRFGQGLIDAAKVRRREGPGLDLFSDRNAGLTILNALLLSGAEGDDFPPRGPIQFSVSALARRFRVSRPHVLRLLRDAQRAGFIIREADEGLGSLEPLLREQVANYYATSFIGYAVSARASLLALENSRANRPSFGRQDAPGPDLYP